MGSVAPEPKPAGPGAEKTLCLSTRIFACAEPNCAALEIQCMPRGVMAGKSKAKVITTGMIQYLADVACGLRFRNLTPRSMTAKPLNRTLLWGLGLRVKSHPGRCFKQLRIGGDRGRGSGEAAWLAACHEGLSSE